MIVWTSRSVSREIPISKPSIVALIPARAGSKRVKNKNRRLLAGKPLIAYTAEAAIASGIFSDVMVCSDDDYIFDYVLRTWPDVNYRARPPVDDNQPDIEWVSDALDVVTAARLSQPDAFAILRPTSPFRMAETIRLAWKVFQSTPCDSLRAVRYARENPYKMWHPRDGVIEPFIDNLDTKGTPWHSLPSQQTMGTLYVQTGGFEMAWTRVVRAVPPTISGERVIPFHLEGPEAFDINTEDDWQEAERLCVEILPHPFMEYLG